MENNEKQEFTEELNQCLDGSLSDEKEIPEEQTAEQEMPDFEGDTVEIAGDKDSAPIVEGKLSAGKITLLVVLAVAAVAVVLALIIGGMGGGVLNFTSGDGNVATTVPAGTVGKVEATIPADGNPDDVTCKGTYTVDNEALMAQLDTVVATAGEAELTNELLQIYYWMQFYDFLDTYSSYASYLGLDAASPLDKQVSLDGTLTWQQFLLDGAINTWRNYETMNREAQKAGFEMPQDYLDFLNNQPQNLALTAQQSGYESVDAMVQADMGPGANMEAYMDYMETYYRGYLYYAHLLEQIEMTDEEVEAYYDEHAEEYAAEGIEKSEDRFVDVRHILISPTGGTAGADGTTYTDEEWEACRVAAQAVLDEYLAGELTEERFAELCAEYSADGNASTGGLYTDVYRGQMVEPFDTWCFDESRVYGDTDLVRTQLGYHVMFFVDTEYIWFVNAEMDLRTAKNDAVLEEILEAYELKVDYSAIALGLIDLHKEQ